MALVEVGSNRALQQDGSEIRAAVNCLHLLDGGQIWKGLLRAGQQGI